MRICAWVSFAVICLTTSASVGKPPLAERLPGETLIYAGWAGRSLPFDGSMLGQMLNSSRTDEILGTIQTSLLTQVSSEDQKQIISDLLGIKALVWQHPLAVALVDLEAQGALPSPRAVLLINLERDRDAFSRYLDSIVGKMAEQGMPIMEVPLFGGRGRMLPTPLGPISMGYMGEIFFLTIGEGTVSQLEKVTAQTSLAGQRNFLQRWREVDGPNEQIVFYADVLRLRQRLEAMLGATSANDAATQKVSDLHRMLEALGLDKVESVALNGRIVDRGLLTRMRIVTPAPHRGLLFPFAGAKLTRVDGETIPEDADAALMMRLSPAAAWKELWNLLDGLNPSLAAAGRVALARMEQRLGITLEVDFLPCLDDSIVISSAPSQGGFVTGTFLSCSVKDSEKLALTLAKMEGALSQNRPLNSYECGQTLIRYASDLRGIAPAWMIHKDRFYFALWPQVLESVVLRGEEFKPLIQQANYRKSRAYLSEKATMVSYFNAPGVIRQLYPLGLVGWTSMTKSLNRNAEENLVRVDWLPALITIEKYLWPEIYVVDSDNNGISVEGYGSIPMGGLWGQSNLLVAIALPSLHRARTLANVAVSATNVKGIGTAIAIYGAMNNDEYPPDLETLILNGEPGSLFVCPQSGHAPPKIVDGKVVGEIDYVYLRPSGAVTRKSIVLYEKLEYAVDGKVNVLYGDGSVRSLSVPMLLSLLAQQQAPPPSD